MNKCIHMGRLTKNPEIRSGSLTVARFSLAVDRKYKKDGEPSADFFNFTAFGKTADFVQKYLKKGTKVIVVSHVQNDNYENKKGEKVYAVNFLVDEIEFAESKGAEKPADTEWVNIPDDLPEDLPFN